MKTAANKKSNLRPNKRRGTPLHKAAWDGNFPECKMIIENVENKNHMYLLIVVQLLPLVTIIDFDLKTDRQYLLGSKV